MNEGALPQMPAGYLVTVALKNGVADCATLKKIDVRAMAPEKPTCIGNLAIKMVKSKRLLCVSATRGRV